MADALYVPDGTGFLATELTRGPWDDEAQHAGPPSALIARALERVESPGPSRIARVALEILRPVPLARLEVETRVLRPGRSVVLLEADLSGPDGEHLIRARAWRIREEPGLVPQGEPGPAPPGPEDGAAAVPRETGRVGYQHATEFRFLRGGFSEEGPAFAWARLRVPLIEGEAPSPLVRLLSLADSGNGISAALSWREWMFVNTDLVVSLFRLPRGEWIGLDSTTHLATDGIGLSDTALRDMRGPIGRATQSLFVARRPEPRAGGPW